VKKDDIKLTPSAVPEKKEEPALLESIKIPGQPVKEQKEAKKIVI
jgi:PIH1 CS-like domain